MQVNDLEQPYLGINAGHIRLFDEDLYRQLVCYPQEVIPTMDMAVNEMFFEKYPDTVLSHQVQVRPFNADKTRNMRALNPEGESEEISLHHFNEKLQCIYIVEVERAWALAERPGPNFWLTVNKPQA